MASLISPSRCLLVLQSLAALSLPTGHTPSCSYCFLRLLGCSAPFAAPTARLRACLASTTAATTTGTASGAATGTGAAARLLVLLSCCSPTGASTGLSCSYCLSAYCHCDCTCYWAAVLECWYWYYWAAGLLSEAASTWPCRLLVLVLSLLTALYWSLAALCFRCRW